MMDMGKYMSGRVRSFLRNQSARSPTTQKQISEGTILGDTLPEEEREGARKRLRSTW